jgi:hydroxysqualene synthase
MTATETTAHETRSGKGSNDENFPVASALIAPRHRGPVLAYYRFARAADDVADHPTLPETDKLALLDSLEATLLGRSDRESEALPLRATLAERQLSAQHALDLLTAFRQDVTKRRYADWGELMHYCRYSAAPVGRFVLDVHGESPDTWPANDALCSALQVINHWQDCAKDYRVLDRVYVPQDALAATGATTAMLAVAVSPAPLRAALLRMEAPLGKLIAHAEQFAGQIRDFRLGIEVAAIVALAKKLARLLAARDPLAETVHLAKPHALAVALTGVALESFARLGRTRPAEVPR